VREALDARAYPPPGQLVDVGGHRLHLQCTGSGGPTVVLEPGQSGASADIAWVSSAVARTSRVCVYDRAGRGWSEAADGQQDAAHIAADLHTLLERVAVPGPYVLAGHSFGGLYVLSFAAQFPDDVAGIVLLDSTAPKPGPAPPADTEWSTVGRIFALVPAIARLGVERLLVHSAYDGLPPEVQDSARANGSTARDLHSSLQEFLHGAASMQQAASLTDFGAKPLIVLTADAGSDATWQTAQQHLATLSTNSAHRHTDATHQSLVGDQADSAAASRAPRSTLIPGRLGLVTPTVAGGLVKELESYKLTFVRRSWFGSPLVRRSYQPPLPCPRRRVVRRSGAESLDRAWESPPRTGSRSREPSRE
jgi:pimeloyl-ACP methyl ester carboxylesterase